MSLVSKLPGIGTTIFSVISRLSSQYDAVNLGQGFPDYPMDEKLISLCNEAMKKGMNQYAPMAGVLSLRERICEKIDHLYGVSIHPDKEVTITPGGTYAIFTALCTVLHPGDEVIVIEPAYDSYIPAILVNGAVPVPVKMHYPGFSIPWDEVKASVTPRTRLIMLNSPHNPSGTVLNATDIENLRQLVAGTDILILSDEVYEHLIYDGVKHESMLRYKDLRDRSFICFSFGKVFNCTGWKLGYCIAPPAMTELFRQVHQFNCFCCDTPKQHAIAAFLKDESTYLNLGDFLQKKRDLLRSNLSGTGLKLIPSHGSYFECYSYAALSNETSDDFVLRLIKDYGVASIPVSAFYRDAIDNRVIRFCFAKKEETLNLIAEKLVHLK